jgi:hypothetical protein
LLKTTECKKKQTCHHHNLREKCLKKEKNLPTHPVASKMFQEKNLQKQKYRTKKICKNYAKHPEKKGFRTKKTLIRQKKPNVEQCLPQKNSEKSLIFF